MLLLIDTHRIDKRGAGQRLTAELGSVISSTTRETDIVGWHDADRTLAVIFTEINAEGSEPITRVLYAKVRKALDENFDQRLTSQLVITVHLFPEDWSDGSSCQVADVKLYPDVSEEIPTRRLATVAKRCMDILGSAMLLLILSPLWAAIALAIKLTSNGPIIFEQERLGHLGRRFKCLKFRTMRANNDPKIHREYVQKFIAGKVKALKDGGEEPEVFKIQDDPRVTTVGKFLRKTSLDELPQFWNVLRGDMSLVGPRPPVPYEFEVYDLWHRRRVLEVRPGVTGLWQVSGRSRTCFDDMVRLDLRYSQAWSIWLDLRILMATPRAVLTGDGAL